MEQIIPHQNVSWPEYAAGWADYIHQDAKLRVHNGISIALDIPVRDYLYQLALLLHAHQAWGDPKHHPAFMAAARLCRSQLHYCLPSVTSPRVAWENFTACPNIHATVNQLTEFARHPNAERICTRYGMDNDAQKIALAETAIIFKMMFEAPNPDKRQYWKFINTHMNSLSPFANAHQGLFQEVQAQFVLCQRKYMVIGGNNPHPYWQKRHRPHLAQMRYHAAHTGWNMKQNP